MASESACSVGVTATPGKRTRVSGTRSSLHRPGPAVCECVQDPASARVSLDEFTSALTHDAVGLEGRGPARRGRPSLQDVRGRSTVRDRDLPRTCGASQNLWLAARAEGIGVGQYSAMGP